MFLVENDADMSDTDVDVVMIDRDDVSNYNPEQILPQSPEDIQWIRVWLQPTSYDIAGGEYRKHLASHVAGTGSWLTSSATYREWLQSTDHGLLWIKGIPGSGKSVMAASLIDDIAKSNPGCPVLFFFFRQIIDANHEPEALLRDWMDQLLPYSPPLQKQLKTYVDARRSLESMSMEDMWEDLRLGFTGLPDKVFCVADALDEMDQGHDPFLKALGALGQWRPGKAKVLITSRPVPRVEVPLRKTSCLHIRLQESLVDVDISTYVRFTLARSVVPQKDWKVVTDAVPGRANGLFLYAKLAMDAFLEPGADVNQVLSQLPADLNVLYNDLLRDHAQRSGVAADIQHLILQAVTHATRPLRLLELAEMIKTVSPDGHTRDLRTTKSLIRAACGPLLEILADETVSVIHHSFTEYLKGTTRSEDTSGYPVLQKGPTHARLAIACLQYLQAGCLNDINTSSKDSNRRGDYDIDSRGSDNSDSKTEVQVRLEHPFFDYAASNWHTHINNSEISGYDQTEINAEVARFMGHSQTIAAWVKTRWPGKVKNAGTVSQMHIAAKLGLVSYTRELIQNTHDPAIVDAHHGDGKTPLWWAATEGHALVIAELIAAGANPDQEDTKHGLKPLHEAASRNHHEAARVLLKAGVNPLTPKARENPGRHCGNAPTSFGHTPLMYACHNGHLETVAVFLPYLDIDAAHRALAWAAEKGRSKVVSRILQHPGVDINARVREDTPLFLACGGSDPATITTLLQAGADPRINCRDSGDEFAGMGGRMSRTSLQGPYKNNCVHQLCQPRSRGRFRGNMEAPDLQEILSLLIEAGVDIHQPNSFGDTALHGAVSSPVLTRLLLDAGADANATNASGSTPLHKVTSIDAMVLLIEQGHANINMAQENGQTPLLCMLASYNKDVMLKFLEYSPDCNATDDKGNGAVHIMMQWGVKNPEVLKAVLNAGADPNLKNHDGLPPLLVMRNSHEMKILSLLLEAGVDINSTDRNGKTLLFRTLPALFYGGKKDLHEDLQRLIDLGASVTHRDFSGRTILHEAVRCHETQRHGGFPRASQVSRLDFLVGLGLDVNAIDHHGNGLLHELALRKTNYDSYHGPTTVSFWEKLIAMGLRLEQKNYAGRTPLHILCTADVRLSRFNNGHFMPIDFVISHTQNLDDPDNDGVTALHIAATVGGLYTKKLLDAGANPAAITHEGLTPLHLASRCRESNVVGMLLDALRKKQQETSAVVTDASHSSEPYPLVSSEAESPKPVLGVNATAFGNADGITPLFYACRSGRPETVALLLEAGASIDTGKLSQACGEFQEEDGLWKAFGSLEANLDDRVAIPLKLNDISRPRRAGNNNSTLLRDMNPDETTRLGEILSMLIQAGADPQKLDPVGTRGRYNQTFRHYSVFERNAGEGFKNRPGDPFSHFFREASIQTLKESNLVKPGHSNQELFSYFLLQRGYHLVEQLAELGASFLHEPGPNHVSNMVILIRHGFASLIQKIGTIETDSRLKIGDWHAFGDSTKPGLWFAARDLSKPSDSGHNPPPLLVEAVRRQLPNLEVLQLLVEKFGVDINEMHCTRVSTGGTTKTLPSSSAIHQAARGNSWWHAHQALPYLIQAGADVNLRKYNGQTPLHVALSGDGDWNGPFDKDAAKMLIEAGADVNAVDSDGRSCLACARHDIDLTRLLIAHGATVTAETVFAAIDANDAKILQALLSEGLDPNIRRDKPPEESVEEIEKAGRGSQHASVRINDLEPHEEFPLYHAAMALRSPSRHEPKDPGLLNTRMQMVQVLLDKGADPFARFLREVDEDEDPSPIGPKGTSSDQVPEGYEECTLLHDVLLSGRIVDNFLSIPGLDVNHRDAGGLSLLHAACQGGPDYVIGSHLESSHQTERVTLFQRLISLGAELEARDNFGRNVLHHMLDFDGGPGNEYDVFKNSLAEVANEAPDLMDSADIDGKTPLHYAVTRAAMRTRAEIADLFLSAGADPSVVDKAGDGVLHMLACNLDVDELRTFFQDTAARGIDVNGRNAKGETPLFKHYGRPKRSRRAFDSMADEDEEYAEMDAMPMLTELGADFFARDKKGRGLLHVAAGGDVQPFKQLIDLGLDVMLEDDRQRTPIDIAAACGNQEILELFKDKD